jgi:threonine aldolase
MIPLSSDTESRPTEAMRAAMAGAEVGDEQKGEDPSVNRLLQRVCTLLGKEAALFLPSGTMCNLVAIKAHTRPGDVVLVERDAHIARAEAGGAALAAGVQLEGLAGDAGRFDVDTLFSRIAGTRLAPATHAPPATLLCLEQTHNYSGGAVWPLASLREVADGARAQGLAVHLDGARLLNATTASGDTAAEFAACADRLHQGPGRAARRRAGRQRRLHRHRTPLQARLRWRAAPGWDRGRRLPARPGPSRHGSRRRSPPGA